MQNLLRKLTLFTEGLTTSINAATAEIEERKASGDYPKGSKKDMLLFALSVITKHLRETTTYIKDKNPQ